MAGDTPSERQASRTKARTSSARPRSSRTRSSGDCDMEDFTTRSEPLYWSELADGSMFVQSASARSGVDLDQPMLDEFDQAEVRPAGHLDPGHDVRITPAIQLHRLGAELNLHTGRLQGGNLILVWIAVLPMPDLIVACVAQRHVAVRSMKVGDDLPLHGTGSKLLDHDVHELEPD